MRDGSRRVAAVVVLCLSGLAGSLSGARAPFGDLHWRLIGPFRGGRVLAAAGVPGEALHFYFGAVNGGVWETLDAGRTWRPIFDEQPVGSIGALAIAPSDPRVIYVGTGEADMRSDIAQGDGMYKSDDAGRTWRHIGLSDSQQVARIVVHPDDADVVYVAALGHPYGPNDERGIYRSRNGGTSWQKVLGPDANTGGVDVLLEPGNPQVVYAALWQTRRTPWSVYPASNGPGSGVYKSLDGGDHWTRLTGGLPTSLGRIGLAVPLTDPTRVYAMVDAEGNGGLYRSDDGGAHWKKTSGDPRIWQRGWYFGRITVDPKNADRIYALNTIVLRSDDGGATFVPLKGDPTGDDFHDMWIDPADPARQVLATDQGTLVSLNGGQTWSSWLNQPTAQIYRLATDNRFPYMVYGAQQDSGAVGLPSRTTRGEGINLTHFHEIVPGGENDNIAPDPRDPDVIFGGRVERLDARTGQVRTVDPTLAYPGIHRTTWTLPLVFSRRDPRVLYFSHQNLYRTEDGGQRWTQISPDLTREHPGVPPNLDPDTAALNPGTTTRRGVIYAIAPSRVADRDIWVGTDDGLVWRTRDEGGHWDDVTPRSLTPWSKVGTIEASPHDAETAFLAVDRHRLDDFAPYVYRTHDGGKTWALVVTGIARTHAVNVVREDPARRGVLYAGTERGVYVSFDDGDHWQPLQVNLPATSVRDLEVKGVDLVIATHGRGFWIMDDVTPLRQWSPAPTTRLLAPAPAVRLRPDGFVGTPFPKEEPAAANPPAGAVIDYEMAAAPREPVVLVIRDSEGREVRRYSSADLAPAIDLTRIGSAPEWVAQPITLAATPGLHRFVWPLRYSAPPALARGDAFADGVWAPPGRYVVDLKVDGRTFSQPLEVRPDPRVSLGEDGYEAQHRFAKSVEAERVRLAGLAEDVSRLQAVLAARASEAGASTIPEEAAFSARLEALAGSRAGTVGASWKEPVPDSLRHLSARLLALAAAADGADAKPSADAQVGLDTARSALDAAVEAWSRVKGEELAALNAALQSAGRPALAWPRMR